MKNKSKQDKLFLIISGVLGVLVVFGVIYLYFGMNNSPASPVTQNSNSTVSTAPKVAETQKPSQPTYRNAKGETWKLAVADDYQFQVSDAGKNPVRFIEGEINPLDVKPGDTQNMRVVVSSPYGIKEVKAEIQTDNAKKVIPLKKTGIVSWQDLTPPRYRVDENGILHILSKKEIAQNYARLVALDKQNNSATGKVAQAVDSNTAQKEVWTGSWVVEDTHETTYRTVFIATDNKGHSGQLTLAWSDPCTDLHNHLKGDYQLADTCTVDSTDGVAAGNFTGAGGDCGSGNRCTLKIDADFVFYPGYHITLDNNYKISIGTGALRQTYLWVKDNDGDHYPPSGFVKIANDTEPIEVSDYYLPDSFAKVAKASSGSGSGSGTNHYTRQENLTSLTDYDCDDDDSNAYPGQSLYFSSSRANGSYDYNCDGIEEKEDESVAPQFCNWDTEFNPARCVANSSGSGWRTAAPDCGQSGTYLDSGDGVNCSSYTTENNCLNAAGEVTSKTQLCH